MKTNLATIQSWPNKTDPIEVLEWATLTFEGEIALSTSLGPQTLVIIDMLAQLGTEIPVFVLDTGVLFPQTYELWKHVESRYGIQIERVEAPLTLVDQAAAHGAELWAKNPDLCCKIRKVEPLNAHLEGYEAWITGLRRDQSSSRAATSSIEWDEAHGLIKVNPLAWWSRWDVWAYALAHDVPFNPLLNQGYRSIGCTHCSHRVRHDHNPSDERAGRWSGTEKTECGIHFPNHLNSKETPNE
jgi:phosphoadenosine phosphosulfate reductase